MRNSSKYINGVNEKAYYTKGINIHSAFIDVEKTAKEKEKVQAKALDIKNERNERSEIFGMILDTVYYNKSIVELINNLNSKEEYKKYSNYFEIWIRDAISKKQDMVKTVAKYLESGKSEAEILEELSYGRFAKCLKFLSQVIILAKENNEKKISYDR